MTETRNPKIRLSGVTKSFGSNHVLKGVDLDGCRPVSYRGRLRRELHTPTSRPRESARGARRATGDAGHEISDLAVRTGRGGEAPGPVDQGPYADPELGGRKGVGQLAVAEAKLLFG